MKGDTHLAAAVLGLLSSIVLLFPGILRGGGWKWGKFLASYWPHLIPSSRCPAAVIKMEGGTENDLKILDQEEEEEGRTEKGEAAKKEEPRPPEPERKGPEHEAKKDEAKKVGSRGRINGGDGDKGRDPGDQALPPSRGFVLGNMPQFPP